MAYRALVAAACLAVVGLAGCLDAHGGAVFGPAAAVAGGDGAPGAPHWPSSLTARPAAGPAPLLVRFVLGIDAAGQAPPWTVDFGDGTRPLAGN